MVDTEQVQVQGFVEPGFEAVRDAFTDNFADHGEVGAATCLHVNGRRVVDLWGGIANVDTGRPWTEDTLQLVYSTTKGATAACANLLVQRGLLDVDEPVVRYWPEFATPGTAKAGIPVRWLLCHKAGLTAVDATLTLDQALAWDPVVQALEAQAPLWEPGTAHGYHATTFGWLVGELVRRVDPSHRSLGTFLAEEIARPLGIEFFIGLPVDRHARVARLVGSLVPDVHDADPELIALVESFMGPDTMLGRALGAPSFVWNAPDVWNSATLHAAEVPAANGITDARSLSRFYAGLVSDLPADGDRPASKRLLTASQVDAAREVQTDGPDLVLSFETRFGLGFMTSSPFSPYGGAGSFGHAGAGGSVGFVDPDQGLAFGYVMNHMKMNLSGDPRTTALIRACYDAADAEITYI